MSETIPVHLASHEAGQKNNQRTRQGRRKTQRKKRVAENRASDCKDNSKKRGMIDITEVEMIRTRDVVEFISEIAVLMIGAEMNEQLHAGQSYKKAAVPLTGFSHIHV